jgi:hypothetical protein
MDHDRLAMKWKDPERVIGRIVERVGVRSAKGSAGTSSSGSSLGTATKSNGTTSPERALGFPRQWFTHADRRQQRADDENG